MKTNELRIGNWVKVDDLPEEQITLETFATLCNLPHTLSAFKPIPITEEWLLKFWFEKIKHIHEGIIFLKGNLRIKENGTPDYRGGVLDCTVKHVHQLQNLYFALTQKELEIK